jgi:hypothetical protein
LELVFAGIVGVIALQVLAKSTVAYDASAHLRGELDLP